MVKSRKSGWFNLLVYFCDTIFLFVQITKKGKQYLKDFLSYSNPKNDLSSEKYGKMDVIYKFKLFCLGQTLERHSILSICSNKRK